MNWPTRTTEPNVKEGQMDIKLSPAGLAEFHREVERSRNRLLHEIARDAERGAPRDTGELAASISVDEGKGEVAVGADHWQYVEYGTEDQQAQPFMRPALYQRRETR